MKDRSPQKIEETLDPEDWKAMRDLGHRMLDDMMDYHESIRERPVWQPIPDAVKSFLNQDLPEHPKGEETVYREFKENIMTHPLGNIHPRFWGWVIGTGSPMGMLAEMLAAGMNPNVGGADHVANRVEMQVLTWLKQMLGYSEKSSGLLVSGGSMANLVGLAVARNTCAKIDLRTKGMHSVPKQMVVYGSTEMHNSIQKAIELLGLGSESLRKIQVNDDYQMEITSLKAAISEDRAQGHHPFCIIGNAGTVNTGAFDDIDQLADLCREEGLWLHVDGAFGALAELSPSLRHFTKGIQRAHSLAFDLHKWMYMPIEIGCALVRDESAHRNTFAMAADYLQHGGHRGLLAGNKWFSDYGVQLSRGFRALKAWMTISAYGVDKYRRLIEQNVDQSHYLAQLVENHPELELMAPVPLNIVCFRYRGIHFGPVDDEILNELNQELLIRLHESGIAVPSYTTLDGRYVLRAAITNHRSRRNDFDMMINEVVRLGKELTTQ